MDAFVKHALTSPRFFQQGAKFISKNVRDQGDEEENKPKMVDFLFLVLESSLDFTSR